MDPDKVDAVTKWPMPTCKKEVQQFLGFCNYYRRFIEGFAKIAKPLMELTGNSQWIWTPQATAAYQTLKQCLTEPPILVLPNNSKPYKVEVDASDFAVEGILSQEQDDGKWKPVAYISHALSSTERNYEIYDKEMLAIMTALEQWRQYLLGTQHMFTIFMDHKNLEYFHKPQKLN